MAESNTIPLIAVVGPTASGKTSLAVDICEKIGGEAVSCDSMQIYNGMDIATAKPTADEMRGIPHHLIGFLEPDEPFSVAKYCEAARAAINDIVSRGKKPCSSAERGFITARLLTILNFCPKKQILNTVRN